ncbi:MAG: ABC transporter substrate-binding protein [Lentisphaeria bacterium]|nr:ABC transporter substrate-binding protein [Lentisphaeria bacterium]
MFCKGPNRRIRHAAVTGMLLISTPVLTSLGMDMAAGIPKEAWPAAWFAGPAKASEVGLKTFRQSPMLDERVKSGALPPVEERLPDDPMVVEPFERPGRHGGTLRIFTQGAALIVPEHPLTMDPQISRVLPNLVSHWEFKEGGKLLLLHLRPGLRWSDGAPFTADDFVWYHKHIRLNESLTPVIVPRQRDLSITAPDPLTVVFRYEEPFLFILQELAHRGENQFTAPGHFLARYHPDFRDKEELDREAKAAGYMNWMAYFHAAQRDSFRDPIGTPTMRAYQLVSRSPTLQVYERNPYYPKVDPEGRQLPYIDRIQAQVVNNPEVRGAKVSTGQVDFAGSSLQTQDIPLYKAGEDAYRYRTLIWNRLHGVDVAIQFNFTVDDPELRSIFRDRRFRLALSLAINRKEINDIVYFGQGTPRQTTVIPSSRFYEPEFATAHIQYDPERARRLLDAIGMRDVDGDGIRERPDGKPLDVTLEWVDIEVPRGVTMELVCSHWLDVGIDIKLKEINRGLQSARARSNAMQMTIWHADRSTDILFPLLPSWYVPMYISWDEARWTPWSRWYLSHGEQGEEPIPEARDLQIWWDEMRGSVDPARRVELGKRILRSQAENLWSIGTIGLAPQPVVVSNRLHNVPDRGYWGWDSLWVLPYHPATWFLDP